MASLNPTFCCFSGGRKSVLPGICDRTTVLGNHCGEFVASPYARTGILVGSPIHRDRMAAAEMAKLRFVVNVVIDEEKKTVVAFAGDYRKAQEMGIAFLRPYCEVPAIPAQNLAQPRDGTGVTPLAQLDPEHHQTGVWVPAAHILYKFESTLRVDWGGCEAGESRLPGGGYCRHTSCASGRCSAEWFCSA